MNEEKEVPTKIELSWHASKETMSDLVGDLRTKTGVGDHAVGFVYNLGHNARGLMDFPRVITLSGLEDSRFYDADLPEWTGLETRINASCLLDQLAAKAEEYLNSHKYPDWHQHQLKALRDISQQTEGVKVSLKLVSRRKPQYELESYEMME